jgi:hypothetical protein
MPDVLAFGPGVVITVRVFGSTVVSIILSMTPSGMHGIPCCKIAVLCEWHDGQICVLYCYQLLASPRHPGYGVQEYVVYYGRGPFYLGLEPPSCQGFPLWRQPARAAPRFVWEVSVEPFVTKAR